MSSNNELLEALNILEREKNISKETLLEAIENSLVTACKNHFGTSENVKVTMDPQTCEYHVFQEKTVVEQVEDPVEQISLVNAKMVDSKYEIGDIVNVEIQSKEFGRIATQNAKNVILQKIREEERKVLYNQYYSMEKDVVTGVVQRYIGRNVSVNLGKVDAIPGRERAGERRGIPADRAYQGLYSGGEGYVQGTEDSRVKNPSGAGKAPVRV